MDTVDSLITPITTQLVRENPGTISLGQGVANYGPPSSAVAEGVARSVATIKDWHKA